MDTPKISKLLRLMKLLTGNVYQMGKVNRGLTDFKKLIYFTDDAGVMNRSVVEVGGEALVVSQFTLMASTKKRIKNNLVHLH